jgi:hypothetical protein
MEILVRLITSSFISNMKSRYGLAPLAKSVN